MSYCRGEVYVIGTGDGKNSWWECLGCSLAPPERGMTVDGREVDFPGSLTFQDQRDLLEHLREHEAAGHDTDEAIPRCEAELRGEQYTYLPSEEELEFWRMEELMEKLAVRPFPRVPTFDEYCLHMKRHHPSMFEHPELDPFDVMSPTEIKEAAAGLQVKKR